MSLLTVNILQIRDSSFMIGAQSGKWIQTKPILNTFELITKPEIDVSEMQSIFASLAPHLLDELDGLAQSLGITSDKAAALFSGYDVPKTEAMGCTAFITPDYYVRNYDFSPSLYDGVFSLIQPEKAFATAGYNLQVLGRHDGVNDKGLVCGLHFVSNDDYRTGISAWTAVRIVLDTCASVEDAIRVLTKIPHAACYNFSLADREGNLAVVEATPEGVKVRAGEKSLTCVNHFQDSDLQNKNRPHIEGSIQRNNFLNDLVYEDLNQHELFTTFADLDSPLFFTDYDELFGTLHTFSYSFKDSKILTALAQSTNVLEINFEDWVKGMNIPERLVTGIIEEGSKI
ncbi:C45 family autoproteolytic acyltransferase/hydrolase [Chungangia koreensis]|uniref:C45 family autoproteolytic acyltransferase/hydrolase n=1 Tax=Chungangia koreensis TaxID=752657 RepID=A0ABV8X182_9LACT